MDQQSNNLQLAKQGTPVMLVAQPIEQDQISLFDLWQTMTKHKFLIAALCSIFTIIGLSYALLSPSVYTVSTTLVPPSHKDVAEIERFANAIGLTDTSYTPTTAFKYFSQTINLKSIRRDYFMNHGIREKFYPTARSERELHDSFNAFNQTLSWKDGVLSITGSDPVNITTTLNDIVTQVARMGRQNMVGDLQAFLESQKLITQSKIDALLTQETHEKQNRIAQLKEAISIASVLGISDFQLPAVSSKNREMAEGDFSIITSDILYMRGIKSLNAELEALENRKDIGMYNTEIPKLKGKLEKLQKQSIGIDDFRLMRVEEPAYTPLRPIKPRRNHIVLGSLIAGLIFGIFAAFFVDTILRPRNAGA